MDRRTVQWAWAVGLAVLGLGMSSGRAHGQVGPFGGSIGASVGATTGNYETVTPMAGPMGPGMNMNPYLNPYMMGMMGMMGGNPNNAISGRNMGIMYLSNQALNSGIGSGQISGVRGPAPSRTSAKAKAKVKPTGPAGASWANTPGGSAGRYFSRNSPTNTSASRFYSRSGKP